METTLDMDQLAAQFHRMWDDFPGVARLIDRRHMVLASNPIAVKAVFSAGSICAKVGQPESHRGCKMMKMFQTGIAQTDHVLPDRIRGWMPISGYPDVCVHFGLPLPSEEICNGE